MSRNLTLIARVGSEVIRFPLEQTPTVTTDAALSLGNPRATYASWLHGRITLRVAGRRGRHGQVWKPDTAQLADVTAHLEKLDAFLAQYPDAAWGEE